MTTETVFSPTFTHGRSKDHFLTLANGEVVMVEMTRNGIVSTNTSGVKMQFGFSSVQMFIKLILAPAFELAGNPIVDVGEVA